MEFRRQINRSEIVGRTKSKTAVVEALVRSNALNRTGVINYNAYGAKDGVGFEKATEKFIDNFLLRTLVPDYNIKDGKNIFLGSQNRMIRELLAANGLTKCTVKAIVFAPCHYPPVEMVEKMPQRDVEKTTNAYYYQDYKIACPNIEYAAVMGFIRSGDYKRLGFFLKDIDFTLDYEGSFDKYDLVEHLTKEEQFRQEGDGDVADRVIVDNDNIVGRNCLTFMETIGGFSTRQKIYNKMVQMLECKSVRSTVGCHWKDWVCQKETRLAAARDKATERGLTRVEVTFYVDESLPTDEFIDSVLRRIVQYIPKSLVFSTSYASTWKAYCGSFKHSLVCIDRSQDIGVIVYSCNEITKNISGQLLENWSEREKWCLEKLTLNGNLPLDIIETTEVSKMFSGNKKDSVLEVVGNRYYKIALDNSTIFPTRLVSKGGVYSFNSDTLESNALLLQKAGFVEHENCIPYLSKIQASKRSKADAELRKVEALDVNILLRTRTVKKEDKVQLQAQLLEHVQNVVKDIEKEKKIHLREIRQKEKEVSRKKECKKSFRNLCTVPLRDLKQGAYTVVAAKRVLTRFGTSFKLLIQGDNGNYTTWTNKDLTNILEQLEQGDLVNKDGGFLSLDKKELGVLQITGRGTNAYGYVSVYANFVSSPTNPPKESPLTPKPVPTVGREIPTIPREELLPYREYENIIVLLVGSVHKIEAIGEIIHYGTSRLVVKIGDKIYQAGQDLEEIKDELTLGCSIKIEKIRKNQTRHVKYAICSVYDKEDWTAMVDYSKTPMLSKFDGSTCVLDVRSVNIKGTKRKLLLTNTGDIYKLKKSKLEEGLKPGQIYNL